MNNHWQLFGVGHVAKTAKKYGIPYMIAIQDIYPECLFTHKKFPIFLPICSFEIVTYD